MARVDFDTFDPHVRLSYRMNLGARLLDALAAGQETDAAKYATLGARQRLLFQIVELFHDLLLGEEWQPMQTSTDGMPAVRDRSVPE